MGVEFVEGVLVFVGEEGWGSHGVTAGAHAVLVVAVFFVGAGVCGYVDVDGCWEGVVRLAVGYAWGVCSRGEGTVFSDWGRVDHV